MLITGNGEESRNNNFRGAECGTQQGFSEWRNGQHGEAQPVLSQPSMGLGMEGLLLLNWLVRLRVQASPIARQACAKENMTP
jgi:hypothetical protein